MNMPYFSMLWFFPLISIAIWLGLRFISCLEISRGHRCLRWMGGGSHVASTNGERLHSTGEIENLQLGALTRPLGFCRKDVLGETEWCVKQQLDGVTVAIILQLVSQGLERGITSLIK
jgi:hypothetical protein